MEGHLYRSTTNRMLGGVCGGLSQYLRIDPTFIRIFFILIAVWGGSGGLLYLILWMVLPRPDTTIKPLTGTNFGSRVAEIGQEFRQAVSQPNKNGARLIGITLIGLGMLFFLRNLDLPWLSWLNTHSLWPFLLIVAGIGLLYRALKGN